MQQPPLLPERALTRLIAVTRNNGMSVLLVASIAALLEAAQGDAPTACASVLAAGAGAMEVHGAGLLRAGLRRGLNWAVRAEFFLLLIILGYCAFRLQHRDLEPLRTTFHATLQLPMMQEKWAEAQRLGLTEDQYLNAVYRLTYLALAFVSVIYQGCMLIYYTRRRALVEPILEDEA